MSPVIGITLTDNIADTGMNNYTRAVEQHGGIPRCITPGDEPSIAGLDGLLLTGGGDIHPDYFNQPWHPSLNYVNEERDELEIPLFQQALAADLPVFGICRGIQIMSVAMGGSLYQDIEEEGPRETLCHTRVAYRDSRHELEIAEGSLLYELIGARVDAVNSAHHQAVDALGEGFVVTARTEDGIVEAMENPSKRFMLGVQYHPERMLKDPELREHGAKLFAAFIKAAS